MCSKQNKWIKMGKGIVTHNCKTCFPSEFGRWIMRYMGSDRREVESTEHVRKEYRKVWDYQTYLIALCLELQLQGEH